MKFNEFFTKNTYANRGMTLENDINETNKYYIDYDIALIYKKPTPIRITKTNYQNMRIVDGFFETTSTLDYNGVYKGKRIISEEYVKMCSSPQISTNGGWGDYSFQFWMVTECDAYRADGAYGQLTIIFKNHDYILSFQRPEDDKLNIVLDILREEVFNKIK